MSIRRFNVHDDLAVFDRFFDWTQPTFSYLRGEFYDPTTHDLVPKPGFLEQQLKFKEKKLQELKDRRRNDNIIYDEQEKELKLEIDTLRQKITSP
jgi:hypothetical protein